MNIPGLDISTTVALRVANVPSVSAPHAAMHIPDGFVSPAVAIIFWIASAVLVGYALWRLNRDLDERKVPLMGVLAAAIFAGQMLNFSVAGGSSGHLMGAALATILLGPWASIVVMTSVVSIQALIFQDGGLLALGANIFNMAIVGSFVAYAVNVLVKRIFARQRWGVYVSGFLAAWFAIVVAALVAALQLALSGTSPASLAIPAMGGIHMLIGLGEGLITVGALAFIGAARPDLVGRQVASEAVRSRTAGDRAVVIGGLGMTLLLAILSPLASSHPDGLEWAAERLGFVGAAQNPVYHVIPDYLFPGISSEALATIVAGVIGALIVFAVALLAARSRRRSDAT